MLLIEAKPVIEGLKQKISSRAQEFTSRYGRKPKLAVVLVGKDPASVIYTRKKGETAVALGCEHVSLTFEEKTPASEVRAAVQKLNLDPKTDGILIQRPLPVRLDPEYADKDVVYWVNPSKDVDGLHPTNSGQLTQGLGTLTPCTPAGIMELLKFYKLPVEGKVACVIGRSNIVGKPMAALLLKSNATVFQCHSQTKNLSGVTRLADILVVAAGKPKLIDKTFIKPGATVIDVGIHRDASGKLVGDVDFKSASEVAGALTPVPGGVGPMTIYQLISNTVLAAEQSAKK